MELVFRLVFKTSSGRITTFVAGSIPALSAICYCQRRRVGWALPTNYAQTDNNGAQCTPYLIIMGAMPTDVFGRGHGARLTGYANEMMV